MNTGEPWEDTFPLRSTSGEYRWFLSRALPIRDSAGQITRWFGTNTDITEQREAQETLRDADRRKDEFLAMLGHELRNPLAPIRNALHVLERDEDGRRSSWARDIVRRQTDHLIRLVDDLLDVSRITRGKVTLRRNPVELEAVIREAIDTSSPLIDAKRQHLSITITKDRLWLEGDATRLVQVFANLLNNASKFTPAEGDITIAVKRSGSNAEVRIRDTGSGIAAGDLGRIFDLFAQGEPAGGPAGGLGIGLALVRMLVAMHGGSVRAESAGPGRGSEFVVRFPLIEAPVRVQANGTKVDQPLASRRILIVDDNVDAAESLAALLAIYGSQVEMAHSGEAAVSHAISFQPELILLDIGLPDIDGYEAARRIRQHCDGARPLIVALSGYGHEEARNRSVEALLDGHLVKPVEIDAALKFIVEKLNNGVG